MMMMLMMMIMMIMMMMMIKGNWEVDGIRVNGVMLVGEKENGIP